MVRSMTSFGRAQSSENEKYMLSIEMKSVNNRYLDLNIRMPKFINTLEQEIRNLVSKKIKDIEREVSDLKVKANQDTNNFYILNYYKVCLQESTVICKLDLDLAKSYLDCLLKIKDEFNLKNDISVSKIASFQDVVTIEAKEEEIDEFKDELFLLLNNTIEDMLKMREKDGDKLKEDILLKISDIEKNVKEIFSLSQKFPVNYKEKLTERIKELTSDMALNEDRIMTEVAIFADKVAIDEEITRLNSHISQMKDTLDLNEPIGRKLDFIIQEMNRETNTMGSKSNNIELTNLVIDNKNIIEKIREQVQNIE